MGKRTIFVGPADGKESKPLQEEGIALAAVRPGALVTIAATGINESSAAATVFGASRAFANKDEARSKAVSENWTINQNMSAILGRSGEYLNVLVADGNNITSKGVALSSNADGTLKIALTNGTEEILAYSDEIINVSGADALVRVRMA